MHRSADAHRWPGFLQRLGEEPGTGDRVVSCGPASNCGLEGVGPLAPTPGILIPEARGFDDSSAYARLRLAGSGYLPSVLLLIKQAAAKARFTNTCHNSLASLRLMPLPHLPGQLLVTHPAGWHGRGIAWWHGQTLLALAWQAET